jgi:hypothetical protein
MTLRELLKSLHAQDEKSLDTSVVVRAGMETSATYTPDPSLFISPKHQS